MTLEEQIKDLTSRNGILVACIDSLLKAVVELAVCGKAVTVANAHGTSDKAHETALRDFDEAILEAKNK
jgi:hypothetical protein